MGKVLVVGGPEFVAVLLAEEHQVFSTLLSQEALDRVAQEGFSLVMVHWPVLDMDGHALLRRLRSLFDQVPVPVMVIGPWMAPEDLSLIFAAGASDYVKLPEQRAELLARVRVQVQTYERQKELELVKASLEAELAEANRRCAELEDYVAGIKALGGGRQLRPDLLPICAWCKDKVEIEHGHWISLDTYLKEKLGLALTHGICPDCLVRFMRFDTNGINGAPDNQPSHIDRIPKGSSR